MSVRGQILISAILVAAVATGVGFYARSTGSEEARGAMEGHDHAAMGGSGDEMRPVRLDGESGRRIGVTFASVEARSLVRTIRTVGAVSYDETRLASLNPKIDGWVERLHVDFTGAPVRRGDALLEIYSPQLVSAQEELILARRLLDQTLERSRATGEAPGASPEEPSPAAGRRDPGLGPSAGRAAANAADLLASARRRLAYWDIPDDEIARIEESGETRKTLTLRAPATGIVIEKNVVEGARIMPGMNVYRIADLSRVWVETEVFEKDLSLVREGQHARVTFETYPGEVFDGVVTYVYPTVSMETRTGRIRLELENSDLRLKPGMYANVEITVPARERTLVIPRSAVHSTGMRSLVFVRGADGMLVPTEVTPGLVAGDTLEILAGLDEGQVVVTSANFLIDAESNMTSAMEAMPGMETTEEAGAGEPEGHDMGGGIGGTTDSLPERGGEGAGHTGHDSHDAR